MKQFSGNTWWTMRFCFGTLNNAKHMKLHTCCEKWIKMGVAHPIKVHPFKNQSHPMRIWDQSWLFSPIQLTSRGRKKSILILVTLAISPYFVAHIIISFPTFETMYPTSTHSALSENRVPPKPFVNHHVSYSNNPNSGYSLVSDTPHSSRTTCPSEIAAQRRVILSPSSWNFSGTVTRWEWSNGYNEGPEIGCGVKLGWLVNSSYQASPLNGQHEQVQ